MKKIWLAITLLHLPILGMENYIKFDLKQFLKGYKWHERKDALTADQREEFGEYLEVRKKEFTSPDIADIDLATILIDGLTFVERKKLMKATPK